MTKSNVNREFADPALAALGTSVSSDVKPSWASKEEVSRSPTRFGSASSARASSG